MLNSMSQRQKVLIKVVITLVLLGFLAYRMDLSKFLVILLSANLFLLILASLIQVLSVVLLVVRWRAILETFDIYTKLAPLMQITFIGFFFNLFLPSGIGGDFFRAYYLAKRENRSMSTTVTTTVLERSAGLCALLVIGTFFAALQGIKFEGFPLLNVFLVVIVAYIVGNVILFHPWTHRKITALLKRRNMERLETKMELVYRGLNSLRRNKQVILSSFSLSLVIHFFAAVIVWVAALSIAIDAPFGVFLVFVPLINLSIMIPLTINGLGLRETLFYLLFSQIGLPVETAVSLSLVTLLAYILASMPGGIVYSLYKRKEHLDEILVEAESS